MQTETLDKLYLEWSQFTQAKTAKELALEAALSAKDAAHAIALAEAVLKARNEDADVWGQAILDVVGFPVVFEAIVRNAKKRFDAIDADIEARKEGGP